MAPAKSKQAERRQKKVVEEPADEGSVGAGGVLERAMEKAKALALESCIWTVGNEVKDLMQEVESVAKKKVVEEPKEENAEADADYAKEKTAEVGPREPGQIFESLKERLVFFNCLGLGEPATGEEAKAKWLAFIGMEVDGGPRKARKGNPGLDRVLANLVDHMPQYLHLILALMLLRTVLFISWFAILPWTLVFQVASLLVPLELVPQCPTKFRVLGAMVLHGLLLLLFLREFLWRVYFFERIFYLILIASHAYVVRPIAA